MRLSIPHPSLTAMELFMLQAPSGSVRAYLPALSHLLFWNGWMWLYVTPDKTAKDVRTGGLRPAKKDILLWCHAAHNGMSIGMAIVLCLAPWNNKQFSIAKREIKDSLCNSGNKVCAVCHTSLVHLRHYYRFNLSLKQQECGRIIIKQFCLNITLTSGA